MWQGTCEKEVGVNLFAINWWLVLVCVVFSMVNGAIWYHPKVFFTRWWNVVGGGKERPGMENMGAVWLLTIIASAVKALFIGIAVNAFAPAMGGASAVTGLATGALVWTGIVAPAYLVNKLFAGHGGGIWAIETGNHLVDLLVYGLLFGIWQ